MKADIKNGEIIRNALKANLCDNPIFINYSPLNGEIRIGKEFNQSEFEKRKAIIKEIIKSVGGVKEIIPNPLSFHSFFTDVNAQKDCYLTYTKELINKMLNKQKAELLSLIERAELVRAYDLVNKLQEELKECDYSICHNEGIFTGGFRLSIKEYEDQYNEPAEID